MTNLLELLFPQLGKVVNPDPMDYIWNIDNAEAALLLG